MNSKLSLTFFYCILFSAASFSQTYFIKYKENVSPISIEQKVTSNSFLPENSLYRAANLPQTVDYFVKSTALSIPELSRIIKVVFNEPLPDDFLNSISVIDPDIEYIQQAVLYSLNQTPNDSLYPNQWGLHKTQANLAWSVTQGTDSVLLCVIDTGIDYEHPDLENKIFLNSGEIGLDQFGNDKRFNGIDDDGNGFIDDWQGWDFTDRVGFPFDSLGGDYLDWDNDPMDQHGHGTYISGISAAQTNNITGIAGAAPNIKILNLRAFDPAGYGEEDDVAAAILYAVSMGAKVINMSFGDNAFSFVLRDVIRYAYSRNVVLVSSSGNSGSTAPHYPSGYSEVICVGNSNIDDNVASSSNYGSTLDLVAPGSNILTTGRNNSYALISGTSASSPFVSAAAALILSLGNYTNEEVKQILKSTTDDIGSPGWDLRSGAGRLNILKAVSILAPAKIKFNHPLQDFTTLRDTLQINASVLSPFFTNASLYVGTGFNPTTWQTLVPSMQNQFVDQLIHTLPLSSLPDTVFTLRIVVDQNNGRTLEERVNFFINRTPPEVQPVFISSAYYGNKATILASLYTNEPSIVRMYYKREGESEFNFTTLDGFATNNQFVKQLHYGFIPKQQVVQNALYEFYFEAENLVGLKTIVRNNNANFFIRPDFNADIAASFELPYSLPPGNIFSKPLNLYSLSYSDVAIREFSNSRLTRFYSLTSDTFTKSDSLPDQIIKDFGDFNNNGKLNLLTFFIRNGYIFEQPFPLETNLQLVHADSSRSFWPMLAADITKNGTSEIVTLYSDTSIAVWRVNPDLSLSSPEILQNYTPRAYGFNTLDAPHTVVADLDQDGFNELWFIDVDGDIFSYEFNGTSFQKGLSISTEFLGISSLIDIGDFTGNGKNEIAVLVHSLNADIAPFYMLRIYSLINDSLHLVFEQPFIDASREFTGGFQKAENSIKFADLDNDGNKELIIFMFPYSYIYKYNPAGPKIISYFENINSNSIFVGDLNHNGVSEVAFPSAEGVKFIEFAISNKASVPFSLEGYSLDSSSINLSWRGSGSKYYIYLGETPASLIRIDSTNSLNYVATALQNNKNYYFAVRSVDISKPEPISDLSTSVMIYSHTPAVVVSVISRSRNTVIVTFSEKMSNTIENLKAFQIPGVGYPNSISPANQFAYLLTFAQPLPVGLNQLNISGLRDLFGSHLAPASISFTVDPITQQSEFFISSYSLINNFTLKILFNLEVDPVSAQNTANYSFEPHNIVSSAIVDPANPKAVILKLDGTRPIGSIGREYRLKVENLSSSALSGGLSINSGAGSYIVLSTHADDLSDIYVYPNPVLTSRDGKLTFANLPKRARITIFTLSGIQLITIDETDGNGGVDFNLRDQNGLELSSGIYIFRILRLDDSNNELEEKLGKFSILR